MEDEQSSQNITNIIMFLIALGIIAFDFFVFDFNRTPDKLPTLGFIYFIYCALFFFKNLFFDTEQDWQFSFKQAGIAVLISVLQIALPYIVLKYLAPLIPPAAGIILFIIIMFSPWLIYYLFFHVQGVEGKFLNIIKIIWIIFLVGILLFMLTPLLLKSLTGVAATTSLTLSPGDAITSFKGTIFNQFNKIKDLLNTTKDPYLNNQKGQIDKNVNSRLGVFFNKLQVIPNKIIENDNFTLFGKFEVNTVFNNIYVNINCFAEKNYDKKGRKQGAMDESDYFVYGKNLELIECDYPGLSSGVHQLYFEAAFNFETWGYVDYTFVDKDLAMQYYKEGRDVNEELSIKLETIPIYTDGPLKIMMIAAEQPVEVDFEKNRFPKFGINLLKNFDNGGITKVNEVIIQTPKMITLKKEDCSFKGRFVQLTEKPNGFEGSLDSSNYYSFFNPEEKAEALRVIVCDINIDETEYLKQKGVNSKLVKSIILKADYDYLVESTKISVIIEKDPYAENNENED